MPNTKEVEHPKKTLQDLLITAAKLGQYYSTDNLFAKDYDSIEEMIEYCFKDEILEQSEKKEEWVSCSERLPYRDGDSSIYCLVMDTYSGIIVRPYNEYHNCWDQEDGDDHYTEAVGGKITHWMPLPNLPKPPKNIV